MNLVCQLRELKLNEPVQCITQHKIQFYFSKIIVWYCCLKFEPEYNLWRATDSTKY
jgi:hypothetical protein